MGLILTESEDVLEIPRCLCGHTVAHHERDGGLTVCQHPSCKWSQSEIACTGWAEA